MDGSRREGRWTSKEGGDSRGRLRTSAVAQGTRAGRGKARLLRAGFWGATLALGLSVYGCGAMQPTAAMDSRVAGPASMPAATPADQPLQNAVLPPIPKPELPAKDAAVDDKPRAEAVMAAPAEEAAGEMAEADEVEWAWELDDGEWENARAWGAPMEPMPQRPVARRVFPVPDYSTGHEGPRTDFRDTVYWNPSVRTGADGKARVEFYLSDAVTSFRATAQGMGGHMHEGTLSVGEGDLVVASQLPISVVAKLPLEVSRGDVIELPIIMENGDDEAHSAVLQADFGAAFEVLPERSRVPAAPVELGVGQRETFSVALKVVGAPSELAEADQAENADTKITLRVTTGELADTLERSVRVVPEGFPFEWATGGSLAATAEKPAVVEHTFHIDRPIDGTLAARVQLYPKPSDMMLDGLESMLRQPGGCFEQTSSSNYPNIMVMETLRSQDQVNPEIADQAQAYLASGYERLTSFESSSGGFEWFGNDPGHEALTAYGVMQFSDMMNVYDGVDQAMFERTVGWLESRRNGEGGYDKNPHHLHQWANAQVTDVYITWALTEAAAEAGEGITITDELAKEIALVRTVAKKTDDAYLLALAANVLTNVDASGGETKDALSRLAEMQGEDGSLTQAEHSVVMSTGQNLAIETTALALMAWVEGQAESKAARKAADFVRSSNNGWGGYGSTQATVLALESLHTYANHGGKLPEGSRIRVQVNGQAPITFEVDESHNGEIVIGALERFVHVGENKIRIELESPKDAELPYGALVTWREEAPRANPGTAVDLTTTLASETAKTGETVRLTAELVNKENRGQPMTIARIGIPGGTSLQQWQLKELRESGAVDFIETRERELILYYTKLAPKDRRTVTVDLKADVPGTYTAPASSAYLYYTDELKDWTDPLTMTVQ